MSSTALGAEKAAILAVIQRVSKYVQNNEKEFTERVREASNHLNSSD